MSTQTGGCQCGSIRYELTAEPRAAYACHCNECRKQSASAFGISVLMDRNAVNQISGRTKVWSRPTDSGGHLDCHFCPDCGSRLWHVGSNDPDTFSVKGGSLDEPPNFAKLHHIWVSQKMPGVILPDGATCSEKEPK